jgi:hypothetical protein
VSHRLCWLTLDALCPGLKDVDVDLELRRLGDGRIEHTRNLVHEEDGTETNGWSR